MIPYFPSTQPSDFIFADLDFSSLAAAQQAEETREVKMEDEIAVLNTAVTGQSTSMIAMVVWVVVVTLALAVIGVVSFRRWRRDIFRPGDGDSSTGDSLPSSQSSADLSDAFGSDIGNLMEAGFSPSSGASEGVAGLNNGGYQSDNNSLTLDFEAEDDVEAPAPVHRSSTPASSPEPARSASSPHADTEPTDGTKL